MCHDRPQRTPSFPTQHHAQATVHTSCHKRTSPTGAGAAYIAGADATYSTTGAGATKNTEGACATYSTTGAGTAQDAGAFPAAKRQHVVSIPPDTRRFATPASVSSKKMKKWKNAKRETTLRPPLRRRCAMEEPLTPIRNCGGICTVVEEWRRGYFCHGYFSSSTHFDLVTRMARKVWRHSVSVLLHDRHSHAGNCIGLLSNTGLFLSTGKKYLFLLQRHSFPYDF